MGIFWFLRSSYQQCTMGRSNGPSKDGRKRGKKAEKMDERRGESGEEIR